MGSFIYSVWFLNTDAHEGDEDREWIACVAIQAATAVDAQKWGDTLANERSRCLPKDAFVRSSVEPEAEMSGITDCSSLPRITAGQMPTEAAIGW